MCDIYSVTKPPEEVKRMEQRRNVSRRNRETPEETRRSEALSGMIPTYKNPGVTRPGIEPSSPWFKASSLTAQPLRHHKMRNRHQQPMDERVTAEALHAMPVQCLARRGDRALDTRYCHPYRCASNAQKKYPRGHVRRAPNPTFTKGNSQEEFIMGKEFTVILCATYDVAKDDDIFCRKAVSVEKSYVLLSLLFRFGPHGMIAKAASGALKYLLQTSLTHYTEENGLHILTAEECSSTLQKRVQCVRHSNALQLPNTQLLIVLAGPVPHLRSAHVLAGPAAAYKCLSFVRMQKRWKNAAQSDNSYEGKRTRQQLYTHSMKRSYPPRDCPVWQGIIPNSFYHQVPVTFSGSSPTKNGYFDVPALLNIHPHGTVATGQLISHCSLRSCRTALRHLTLSTRTRTA
ncbi:hypothetical protein PR048_029993 [Dryococelus australis]|uniref:Uncharacterized protein n=1 Tax=Dryococelus australis TaxID=614101 RepID=A0ABQ9G7P3_9NEOP|nr:hypothetical protein PR048_029993 [Dryococelus australis]